MPTHQSEITDNVTTELEELPVNLFISRATNHHLPKYIQNILLAYGYDRLELVAQMDVNNDSGQPNDIDKMLQYVQQNFPSDVRSVNHFVNHNSPKTLL